MSGQREFGPQDDCIQCGETKDAIRESQRRKDPLFCAIVDYEGECMEEFDRHRFVWTAKDQQRVDEEAAFWASFDTRERELRNELSVPKPAA